MIIAQVCLSLPGTFILTSWQVVITTSGMFKSLWSEQDGDSTFYTKCNDFLKLYIYKMMNEECASLCIFQFLFHLWRLYWRCIFSVSGCVHCIRHVFSLTRTQLRNSGLTENFEFPTRNSDFMVAFMWIQLVNMMYSTWLERTIRLATIKDHFKMCSFITQRNATHFILIVHFIALLRLCFRSELPDPVLFSRGSQKVSPGSNRSEKYSDSLREESKKCSSKAWTTELWRLRADFSGRGSSLWGADNLW